jgi:hypothetical protein
MELMEPHQNRVICDYVYFWLFNIGDLFSIAWNSFDLYFFFSFFQNICFVAAKAHKSWVSGRLY